MNSLTSTEGSLLSPQVSREPAPDEIDAVCAEAPSVNERLCHLFRASLKNGRIHPLYLPILKYRHSRADT